MALKDYSDNEAVRSRGQDLVYTQALFLFWDRMVDNTLGGCCFVGRGESFFFFFCCLKVQVFWVMEEVFRARQVKGSLRNTPYEEKKRCYPAAPRVLWSTVL